MEDEQQRKYLIETGMGLQAVDGLKNSVYFLSLVPRYIKGEISLDEFGHLIDSYYKNKTKNDEQSKMSSRESNIIEIIKGNPRMTSEEMAKLLGISTRTVKTSIKYLVDNKIIKRINGKRFGYWEIIEKK